MWITPGKVVQKPQARADFQVSRWPLSRIRTVRNPKRAEKRRSAPKLLSSCFVGLFVFALTVWLAEDFFVLIEVRLTTGSLGACCSRGSCYERCR
jgi:hypothetical protein